jgi:hypothetical protein
MFIIGGRSMLRPYTTKWQHQTTRTHWIALDNIPLKTQTSPNLSGLNVSQTFKLGVSRT